MAGTPAAPVLGSLFQVVQRICSLLAAGNLLAKAVRREYELAVGTALILVEALADVLAATNRAFRHFTPSGRPSNLTSPLVRSSSAGFLSFAFRTWMLWVE